MSSATGESMGGVYAEALAEAAEAKGVLADVGAEIAAFATLWREQQDVRTFFLSGAIRREAKTKAIDHVFQGRASDLFTDFLHVLLRRTRLWLLPSVADAFSALLDRKTNRVRVALTTASPVAPADLDAWKTRLRAAIGKEPVLTHHVRPGLIGGAVLRVGDVVADGSVRRRLTELTSRIRLAGDHALAAHPHETPQTP